MFHFTFERAPGRVVPGVLLEPSGVEAGKKLAVVIAFAWYGGELRRGELGF